MVDALAPITAPTCSEWGLHVESKVVSPPVVPLADNVPMASTIRCWKRQARANPFNEEVQVLSEGHKRKAEGGLKAMRKGMKPGGKRGKTNHVLFLKDTEELTEADVQLRQQP
jgi:hypothetical protein